MAGVPGQTPEQRYAAALANAGPGGTVEKTQNGGTTYYKGIPADRDPSRSNLGALGQLTEMIPGHHLSNVVYGIVRNWYGIDDKGNPTFGDETPGFVLGTKGFLGELPALAGRFMSNTMAKAFTGDEDIVDEPGYRKAADEVFTPPEWATEASAKPALINNAVREDMNIPEPMGFFPNMEAGAGDALSQFMVPGGWAKAGKYLTKAGAGALDLLTPVIEPSLKGVLANSALVGGLGAYEDYVLTPAQEEEERKAQEQWDLENTPEGWGVLKPEDGYVERPGPDFIYDDSRPDYVTQDPEDEEEPQVAQNHAKGGKVFLFGEGVKKFRPAKKQVLRKPSEAYPGALYDESLKPLVVGPGQNRIKADMLRADRLSQKWGYTDDAVGSKKAAKFAKDRIKSAIDEGRDQNPLAVYEDGGPVQHFAKGGKIQNLLDSYMKQHGDGVYIGNNKKYLEYVRKHLKSVPQEPEHLHMLEDYAEAPWGWSPSEQHALKQIVNEHAVPLPPDLPLYRGVSGLGANMIADWADPQRNFEIDWKGLMNKSVNTSTLPVLPVTNNLGMATDFASMLGDHPTNAVLKLNRKKPIRGFPLMQSGQDEWVLTRPDSTVVKGVKKPTNTSHDLWDVDIDYDQLADGGPVQHFAKAGKVGKLLSDWASSNLTIGDAGKYRLAQKVGFNPRMRPSEYNLLEYQADVGSPHLSQSEYDEWLDILHRYAVPVPDSVAGDITTWRGVRLPKNATIDDYLKTTTGEHPAYTDLTEEGTHGYALHPAARHMSPTEYADIVVTGHPNILKIKPEPGVNIFPNVPGIANEVIYPPGHKMTRTSDPWDKLIGDRFFGFNWGNPDVPAKAAEVLISKRRRPPRRTNMQEGGSVKDHCEGGMATISSMKRKYAAGGQTKGGDPVQAITDALAHLDQGDSSAALQALQRSPQAMQDPGIQAALGNMQKFAKGGKLSALKTYMVSYSLKSQPGGGGARIVRAISPKDARVRLEAQNSDHKVLGVDPWFNSAKSKAMDKAERIDPVKLAKGGKVNQIANIARMALKKGVTRNVTDYSDTDVNRLLKALRSRKPESGAARRIERHHQIAGDLLDDMYEGAEGSVDNWEAARGELKTLHGAMDRVAKVGKKVPKAKGGSVPGYAKAGRVLLTAAGKPKTWYHVSSASPEVVTTKLKAATPTAAKNEIEKQLLKNSRDFRPADRADKVLTSSPTHKEYRLPGDRRFRWTITSDKKKAEEAAKRYDSPGHSDDDLYDD